MAGSAGMFNFDSIMKEFYSWKPAADDAAGQAMKNTFQGDFIQTVLNNQMSKDLAFTNAGIATGQMTTAAALELANQKAVMKDEHAYGQLKMGAEYQYQSKFAVDEANRDLNKLSHTATLQQNQTKLEGEENRLNIDAQGRNDLDLQGEKNKGALDQINSQGNIDKQLQGIKGEQAIEQLKEAGINEQALQELKNAGVIEQIMEQGDVDKAIQAMKEKGALDQIGAQGIEALKQIESQGFLDNELQKLKGEQATEQIDAQGQVDKDLQGMKGEQAIEQLKQSGLNDQQIQKLKDQGALDQIDAQGGIDKWMQSEKGSQALAQIGAQGSIDKDLQGMKGDQAMGQIKETGRQERKGMMQATKEDTKKQKRDSGMARGLAGMF